MLEYYMLVLLMLLVILLLLIICYALLWLLFLLIVVFFPHFKKIYIMLKNQKQVKMRFIVIILKFKIIIESLHFLLFIKFSILFLILLELLFNLIKSFDKSRIFNFDIAFFISFSVISMIPKSSCLFQICFLPL